MSNTGKVIVATLFTGSFLGSFLYYKPTLIPFAHFLSTSLWFGMTFFHTGISGFIMFKELSWQKFADTQSKIFPVYFLLQTITSLIVTFAMKDTRNKKHLLLLLSGFVCNVAHLFVIEPWVMTKLKKYGKIRKEEGENSKSDKFIQAKKEFFKTHGISSLINLVSFFVVTMHIAFIVSKVQKVNL